VWVNLQVVGRRTRTGSCGVGPEEGRHEQGQARPGRGVEQGQRLGRVPLREAQRAIRRCRQAQAGDGSRFTTSHRSNGPGHQRVDALAGVLATREAIAAVRAARRYRASARCGSAWVAGAGGGATGTGPGGGGEVGPRGRGEHQLPALGRRTSSAVAPLAEGVAAPLCPRNRSVFRHGTLRRAHPERSASVVAAEGSRLRHVPPLTIARVWLSREQRPPVTIAGEAVACDILAGRSMRTQSNRPEGPCRVDRGTEFGREPVASEPGYFRPGEFQCDLSVFHGTTTRLWYLDVLRQHLMSNSVS